MADFLQAAAHIEKGIEVTVARVAEMRKLCTRRSVFDDREDKIAELRQFVKQDFTGLGKDIELLEKQADSDPALSARTHTRSHTKAVVGGLQAKVTQAAKEFAEVLQKQNKTLKEESSRRSRFESTASVGHLRMRKRAVDGFWQKRNQASHSEQMRLQQLQQQETESKYLDRRANSIQSIQSTLNELGTVYNKMANIVASQQEIAIRIDENMSATLEHTEMGHNQLMKYFTSISGNRGLILKVFGLLLFFTVLFAYLKTRS